MRYFLSVALYKTMLKKRALNQENIPRGSITKAAMVWILVMATTSCSSLQSINEKMPWYAGNDVENIGLQVMFDTQLEHALSVDIVFVYDENLLPLLFAADAGQWFQERAGYLTRYGTQMDVIHREIVPGYSEFIRALPNNHSDAKAVFAFAYYPFNPKAKADLTLIKTPWLTFDAQTMTVLNSAPTFAGNQPQ